MEFQTVCQSVIFAPLRSGLVDFTRPISRMRPALRSLAIKQPTQFGFSGVESPIIKSSLVNCGLLETSPLNCSAARSIQSRLRLDNSS